MLILTKCPEPYIDGKGRAFGCGQCPLCRNIKRSEWVMRGYHELITNPKAIYITLTYNPKNLKRTALKKENKYDKQGTLIKEDVPKFIKKLRKVEGFKNRKLKIIYCGEYGTEKWRPHYHLLIYGINYNEAPGMMFEALWEKGHVDISREPVTENCVSYIVGYVSKKLKNEEGKEAYEKNNRIPPFMRTSKGIGKEWALKNMHKWAETGKIKFAGGERPIPRYYIKLLKKEEGRNIKFQNWKQEPDGIKKIWSYKTIENPHGIYTKKINEITQKLTIEKVEKYQTNIIEKKTLQKVKNEYIEQKKKDKEEKLKTWEEYAKLTDEEIKTISAHEIKSKAQKLKENKNRGKTYKIDKEIYKLRRLAKYKIDIKSRGAFGQRNLYDFLSENE